MKPDCVKVLTAPPTDREGFTLVELLVVVAIVTVLTTLHLSGLALSKDHIKIGQCASNLRRFALATQIYSNENRDKLPEINVGSWAWDMPVTTANALLARGMEKRNFYCPGTAPRFNDNFNFLNAYPNSLWTFGEPSNFRVIGYVTAFAGPVANPAQFSLILSNQNTTTLPEPPKLTTSVSLPAPSSKDRVLLADATISEFLSGTAANPAAAGSFTIVAGGFAPFGTIVPHLTPHLNGTLPAGGNLAFKDGHVQWRRFVDMSQRASGSSRGFWW